MLNMKVNSCLEVFLVCLLISGCTFKGKLGDRLPTLKSLDVDSISIPPVLLSVTRLFIANDMLVAYEQRRDTLFSFWSLPHCDYLFSAGTKGQGPNEFLMLDRTCSETPQGFKLFELASNKVKEVAFDASGAFKVVADRQLNIEERGLNRFLFLEKGRYCFVSDKEEHEFVLLDEKEDLTYFGDYPDGILEKGNDEQNRFVYNKLTVSSPRGDKFASFYAYIKCCRIYDSKGEMLVETMLEQPKKTISGERHVYYSSYPYADNEYIYLLTDENEKKVLEVWDWEGALVARYLLDKPIDCLAVYSKQRKVYAVCKENENVIYTFDIP